MTQGLSRGPQSMRYNRDEVLSGMLASISRTEFTDDAQRLTTAFKTLSQAHPLLAGFAPASNGADSALTDALQKLVDKSMLQHEPGRYALTERGRAACISSKKILFKTSDIAQLEAAAHDFETHLGT